MRRTTALLTLSMACALPLAASAQSYQSSSTNMQRNAQRTTSTRQSQIKSNAARGGGPEHAAATTEQSQRSQQLHQVSPHIVFVQTKIDSAQAGIRGMERLASLEHEPMTSVYREHARGLTQDVQRDISEAKHHLDELRSSVQPLQVSASVNNDIAQAERALTQANSSLQQFQSAGLQQGQDVRSFGNSLSRELNSAKTAVDRVERGLH